MYIPEIVLIVLIIGIALYAYSSKEDLKNRYERKIDDLNEKHKSDCLEKDTEREQKNLSEQIFRIKLLLDCSDEIANEKHHILKKFHLLFDFEQGETKLELLSIISKADSQKTQTDIFATYVNQTLIPIIKHNNLVISNEEIINRRELFEKFNDITNEDKLKQLSNLLNNNHTNNDLLLIDNLPQLFNPNEFLTYNLSILSSHEVAQIINTYMSAFDIATDTNIANEKLVSASILDFKKDIYLLRTIVLLCFYFHNDTHKLLEESITKLKTLFDHTPNWFYESSNLFHLFRQSANDLFFDDISYELLNYKTVIKEKFNSIYAYIEEDCRYVNEEHKIIFEDFIEDIKNFPKES